MKVHATICIDYNLWNLVQKQYPKKVSFLIEQYLTSIISNNSPQESEKLIKQIETETSQNKIAVYKLKEIL